MNRRTLSKLVVFLFFVLMPSLVWAARFHLEWDPNTTEHTGVTLYYGPNAKGPYNGTNIAEGASPLDIPNSESTFLPDGSQEYEVTILDDSNTYMMIRTYNDAGESNPSGEASLSGSWNLHEIKRLSDPTNTIQIVSTKGISAYTNTYEDITPDDTVRTYTFNEEFLIRKDSLIINTLLFIGKETGRVWALLNDEYSFMGNFNATPILWLNDPGMVPEDAFVLNVDRGLDSDKGDDICLINYQTGELKVFLNTGSAFSPAPIDDWNGVIALGQFSANYAFQRGTAGDFNGDGFDDIAIYSPITKNLVVILSDGEKLVSRSVWANGGGPYAYPYAIDYDGDAKKDIIFFNFVGGAFSAFRSSGTAFSKEVVRTFSPNAFSKALVGNLIINSSHYKDEFAMHARDTTGNLVIFEYAPDYLGDPDPFKTRSIWLNSWLELY